MIPNSASVNRSSPRKLRRAFTDRPSAAPKEDSACKLLCDASREEPTPKENTNPKEAAVKEESASFEAETA